MQEDKVKSFWTWAIIGGAAILVAAIVVFTGKILWDVKPDLSSVVLPLILIVGVLVLVTLLGLLTAVFSSLSLANPNEALGLPSGSVRAVIALMLILVFAVMAIFFYSSLGSGDVVGLVDGGIFQPFTGQSE